jgi:hypothetical protein
MASGNIADDAIDAHRSRGLDDDDAVDDEMPQLQRSFKLWLEQSACFVFHEIAPFGLSNCQDRFISSYFVFTGKMRFWIPVLNKSPERSSDYFTLKRRFSPIYS